MRTIIFYYSATGNSLYASRFLQDALGDTELRSIPEELARGGFTIDADRVGFVFPLHYMGLPMQVEAFLENLVIPGHPYLFAIATCGVPYLGQPFADADSILSRTGHHLTAAWFLRLVSNYIPLRDIAADWRINIRARLAEKKLKKIASSVKNGDSHTTWQLLRKPCRRLHEEWKDRRQRLDENFRCDENLCTSCGLCSRVCPTRNIELPEGHPVWNHRCVECMGCLHICPVKAIEYGDKTKGRKRYRHSRIPAKDLLRDFPGPPPDNE